LDDNEALVARFRQEARALFAIEHPAVVRIFDLLETSEGPVLIMERVRGRPLSGLLAERGALPCAHAFAVASALADALRAVHARGVIHRDIKPDNVLVLDGYDPDGAAPPRVKLVDFGIAKLPDGACEHRTIPGVTMGTPAYMAPEQIGGGPTSPATDVFALAALLVEMLSGARAFAGDTQWVLRQKLSGAVPKLALPRESAGLRRLLLGGLQHDPRLRPDLDTFARALEGDAQAPRWWLPAILTAAMLAGAILGWSASETPAHAARPVASAAR